MALLNLSKLKKGDEKPAGEVPEELPSLPKDGDKGAQAAEQKPAGQATEQKPAGQAAEQQAAGQAGEQKPAEAQQTEQKHAEGQSEEQPTAKDSSGEGDKYQQTLQAIKDSSQDLKKGIQEMKGGAGLAPDELPPLTGVNSGQQSEKATLVQQAKTQNTAQASSTVLSETPKDQKLYFSQLITKFHNTEMQKDVEKEILSSASSDVISHLHSQWEDEKHEENLAQMEKDIYERMQPLQRLESEWRILRTEIDVRQQLLKEKEKQIKKATLELKDLLKKKSKSQDQLKTKSKKSKKSDEKPG